MSEEYACSIQTVSLSQRLVSFGHKKLRTIIYKLQTIDVLTATADCQLVDKA